MYPGTAARSRSLRGPAITGIDSPHLRRGGHLMPGPFHPVRARSTDLSAWELGGNGRGNVVGTWESDCVSPRPAMGPPGSLLYTFVPCFTHDHGCSAPWAHKNAEALETLRRPDVATDSEPRINKLTLQHLTSNPAHRHAASLVRFGPAAFRRVTRPPRPAPGPR